MLTHLRVQVRPQRQRIIREGGGELREKVKDMIRSNQFHREVSQIRVDKPPWIWRPGITEDLSGGCLSPWSVRAKPEESALGDEQRVKLSWF